MKELTVIIPTVDEPDFRWKRENVAYQTLGKQRLQNFDIITVWDQFRKGAAWARNEGFKGVKTEFVLFSDDDINWKQDAIQKLTIALMMNPEASYSYGAYRSNWIGPEIHTIGFQEFDAELLKRKNYISTMSMIRSSDFPGFDESLKRHQDWDLWLNMLSQGKTGVFCGHIIFETRLDGGGISHGSIPIHKSREIIRRKHAL